MNPKIFHSRAELLANVDHPYLRFAVRGDDTAYLHDGTVVNVREDGERAYAVALGEPDVCRALLRHVRDTTGRTTYDWLHAPAGLGVEYTGELHDWEFRWTATAPAPHPAEGDVTEVDDSAAINEVLDLALPESSVRPGDGRDLAWYGIRVDGRLAAVGADTSAGGVGGLSGCAVHPAHQGRGLGTALTTAVTRRLLASYDVTSLAVYSVNHGAIKLYERQGYTSALRRLSGPVRLDDL